MKKKISAKSNEFSAAGHSNLRIIIVGILFLLIIAIFIGRLMLLQIAKNEYYASLAVPKVYRDAVIETSRGEICDRNGVVLVSNSKQCNVRINRSYLDTSNTNATLLTFIELCEKYDINVNDSLPVSTTFPYELDKEYVFDANFERKLNYFLKKNEISENTMYETGLYNIVCDRYGISEEARNEPVWRKIAGLRYDMEVNDFSTINPYTLLYDVDERTKTVISENLHLLHGIELSYTDKRFYNLGSTAAHILGRTGPILSEDVEEYVNQKGYSYDAIVGRDGVEKAFEEYLRGIDGLESFEIGQDNNVENRIVSKAPKQGYTVSLTIDSGMQQTAEKALEEQINEARAYGLANPGNNNGSDCKAGSVVVMKPNTGEVLVSASYPSYDLNQFSELFSQLNSDTESRPLVNRATQGIYPPGSTFKIATAAAALSSETVTTDTIVYDKGVYTKYETYQPHCWIYDSKGETHGYVNVKSAIEGSCNYYFYEIADMMGIDTLVDYASRFGLGKETGIEIPENTGILASPSFRDGIGLLWNPGDTLQAAIGQSDNAFTPIQLCSYMSTVLNGGTRYKTTLLKSVNDFSTQLPIVVNQPVILDSTHLSEDTVSVLKSAMRQVVVDGTARNVFDSYPFEIGGKTGTAQVSGGSDTALFVGFAPYDNPEIVVAVVVENASASSRASNVAKEVFDYYFKSVGMLEDETENANVSEDTDNDITAENIEEAEMENDVEEQN